MASSDLSCGICKIPVKASYLFRHHSKYHSEKPKIKCTNCPKEFDSRGRLSNHMNTDHPVNNLNFEGEPAKALREIMCSSCDKMFVTAERMLEHNAYTHTVDPVPSTCGSCKKSFENKRMYKRHVQKNHLNLPCNICEKKLGSSVALKTHKKKSHSEP